MNQTITIFKKSCSNEYCSKIHISNFRFVIIIFFFVNIFREILYNFLGNKRNRLIVRDNAALINYLNRYYLNLSSNHDKVKLL